AVNLQAAGRCGPGGGPGGGPGAALAHPRAPQPPIPMILKDFPAYSRKILQDLRWASPSGYTGVTERCARVRAAGVSPSRSIRPILRTSTFGQSRNNASASSAASPTRITSLVEVNTMNRGTQTGANLALNL